MYQKIVYFLGFAYLVRGDVVLSNIRSAKPNSQIRNDVINTSRRGHAMATTGSFMNQIGATSVRSDVGTMEPIVIDSSERQKSCPSGYEEVGKQCARTIYVQPEVMCTNGGTLTPEGNCIHYLAKNSECLAGFTRTDSLCVRRRTAPKELSCPENYLIRNDRNCVRTAVLNDKEICPPGSQPKGDICVIEQTQESSQVCPQGFTLSENKCVIEEMYDCTPLYEKKSSNNDSNEEALNSENELNHKTKDNASQNDTVETSENRNENESKPNNNHNDEQGSIEISVTRSHPKQTVVIESNSAIVINDNTNVMRKYQTRPQVEYSSNSQTFNESSLSDMLSRAGYRISRPERTQNDNMLNRNQYVLKRSLMPAQVNQGINVNDIKSSLTYKQKTSKQITSSQALAAVTRDYIAASICKRVRVIPSEYICTRGVLDGKICRYDVQVPKISVPGGISESVVDPSLVCPNGFYPDESNDALCMVEDEMTPEFFCPTGTEEQGNRCVYMTSSQTICGPGFALEGNMCAQTQIAAPLVKYTVTFACEGKSCQP